MAVLLLPLDEAYATSLCPRGDSSPVPGNGDAAYPVVESVTPEKLARLTETVEVVIGRTDSNDLPVVRNVDTQPVEPCAIRPECLAVFVQYVDVIKVTVPGEARDCDPFPVP